MLDEKRDPSVAIHFGRMPRWKMRKSLLTETHVLMEVFLGPLHLETRSQVHFVPDFRLEEVQDLQVFYSFAHYASTETSGSGTVVPELTRSQATGPETVGTFYAI